MLKERLQGIKEEANVQNKAQMLYDFTLDIESSAVSDLFDSVLASSNYVKESIGNEATEGNLLVVKNMLEGITDFSVKWYIDHNDNFEDLDMETLDCLIYDIEQILL